MILNSNTTLRVFKNFSPFQGSPIYEQQLNEPFGFVSYSALLFTSGVLICVPESVKAAWVLTDGTAPQGDLLYPILLNSAAICFSAYIFQNLIKPEGISCLILAELQCELDE